MHVVQKSHKQHYFAITQFRNFAISQLFFGGASHVTCGDIRQNKSKQKQKQNKKKSAQKKTEQMK